MEKFDLGGHQVNGERKAYNTISEPWNEYLLEDGSTIRLKLVVKDIIKTDKFHPDRTPVYIVQSTNVVDARVPENLKQQGEGK